MSQETDDFDALEALLRSAEKQANKIRERSALRRIARTKSEVSEDYAERLAEKAVFRRLLSDEALDGVRFRWLFEQYKYDWKSMPSRFLYMHDFRKWIDEQIAGKEGIDGPSA